MAKSETISIACASAFWGDTPFAVGQLLREPQLDFIVFDYLSEVTMGLLARAQKKDPTSGYAADFLSDVIDPYLAEILKRKIRLVSNAGGLNPEALMKKITETAARLGLSPRVICVEGDDLRGSPHLTEKNLVSANAYLGASGITLALDEGADIVLTGRIVDTALVVGPLAHSFDWTWDKFDLLAQASLAGHIIECGTQCTGGNFTDWHLVPNNEDVGFPIVRFASSGVFTVEKPPGTGGLINAATVAEQIVYEIGNPAAYILPDVTCDFREVQLSSPRANVVEVRGARGFAPPDTYKVSATEQRGWRISTTAFIGGGNGRAKAKSVGEAILKRCQRFLKEKGFSPFTETRLEVLGSDEEVLLRLSAAHEKPDALDILAKEIAPAGTSLAPGVANLLGGRAHAIPRMAFRGLSIEKEKIQVVVSDGVKRQPVAVTLSGRAQSESEVALRSAGKVSGATEKVSLSRLAYARSGDKGNHVNVGVIAREPKYFPILNQALSNELVAGFFSADFDSAEQRVESWEMPGIHAVNFLILNCLGGGGTYSLRVDPQGKAFAQRLLHMEIEIPKGLL